MYKYYYCKQINDNFYNSKINLDKLPYLIKKYDLEYKNYIKEYWINNVLIISNNNDIKFYKIYDKDIQYQNEYIVKSYDIDECIPFNFNKTHSEEEYILYENIIYYRYIYSISNFDGHFNNYIVSLYLQKSHLSG